jgi:phosphatidylserine/phosphatidylglycerophosphate/cardiolipin synthase-like enzyme
MAEQAILELLAKTLADAHLSRSERQSLRAVLEKAAPTEAELARYRHEAFALARQTLAGSQAEAVLGWLEETLPLLQPAAGPAAAPLAETFFSPRDDCARQLAAIIGRARHLLDICVFTITDDRIAEAIRAAHRRGVQVRIISDDEKTADLGSDIARLRSEGIAVRLDRSPAHMHHKFALFDKELLLTGSYNWTRGAASLNWENLILINHAKLVTAFQHEFDRLWAEFQ